VGVVFLIIVVLFIVVPFIGVVASRMRDASQPAARPLAQGDNRRIQEQIDEFLRRASQRRGGPAAPPPQAQVAPVAAEVLDDDEVGTGVGQQVQQFLDTSEFRRRSDSLGDDVAEGDAQFTQQVRKAFSGDVGKLSARRGESAAAPEVVEAEVVADEISRPTLEAPPAAGSGLAELLGSPDNIVHAIIMSEILRQPEW
jgi:hypothetical protein